MTTPMLESVVNQELCTRCGCCAAVCPQNCISIDTHAVRGQSCITCGLCTKVCSGTGTDLRKTAENLFKGLYNEYVGQYIATYTGYSTDEAIREKATSGGVVTSLLVCLLEEGVIDGAVVVSFDEEPWKTTYKIATTKEEIIESAQTKYQVTPLDVSLKDCNLRKIAVVGLPCVIQGLRKIQSHSAIGEKIAVLIGLFCWVNMEREATEFLLNRLNVTTEEVQSIEYRSGDYLGGFKVHLKDGSVKFLEKECYNVLPLLFAPERCVYCPDFTNELADISVGDAKSIQSEKGHTFVVTRSERGEELLKKCVDKKYIRTDTCDIEEIIQSESSSLLFKKGAYRRIQKKKKGIEFYGEEYRMPLKNQLFELVFMIVHKNRKFFKPLFRIMPLSIFKIVSQWVTKERS